MKPTSSRERQCKCGSDMEELEWSRFEKTWTPLGSDKEIPFVVEEAWLDDESDYKIEISKWTKNVTVKLIYFDGDNDCDLEGIAVVASVVSSIKLPRKQFEEQRESIIKQMIEYANHKSPGWTRDWFRK